ncbi:hypothetical protein KFE98_20235 [bacterium SCSIO 12741]|nr:hypothetical protein KFE98_20235 [bacterium SCSIO 12741]
MKFRIELIPFYIALFGGFFFGLVAQAQTNPSVKSVTTVVKANCVGKGATVDVELTTAPTGGMPYVAIENMGNTGNQTRYLYPTSMGNNTYRFTNVDIWPLNDLITVYVYFDFSLGIYASIGTGKIDTEVLRPSSLSGITVCSCNDTLEPISNDWPGVSPYYIASPRSGVSAWNYSNLSSNLIGATRLSCPGTLNSAVYDSRGCPFFSGSHYRGQPFFDYHAENKWSLTTVTGADYHPKSFVRDTICLGDSSLIYGVYRKNDGYYYDTVQAVSPSCRDTIKRTFLHNTRNELWQNVLHCDTTVYTFRDGDTATVSKTDSSVVQTLGCDSLIVTNLTVAPSYIFTTTDSLCEGKHYYFPDGSFTRISKSILDTTFLSTQKGCDSILIVSVKALPAKFVQQNASICEGQVYTFLDGDTSTVSRLDTARHQTIGYCDQMIITKLTRHPVWSLASFDTICQGDTILFPDGQKGFRNQKYLSRLVSSKGCDSLIETHLVVKPSFYQAHADTICQGQTHTLPDGSLVDTTGVYTLSYQNVVGCDSIFKTSLWVNPSYHDQYFDTICEGELFTFPNGDTTSVPRTLSKYTLTMHGCDSLEEHHLMVIYLDTQIALSNSVLESKEMNATQYTWIDCKTDQPVTGETSRSFEPKANGSYALILERSGCMDTSACYTVNTVGVGEESSLSDTERIRIYPNPTSGPSCWKTLMDKADFGLLLPTFPGRRF